MKKLKVIEDINVPLIFEGKQNMKIMIKIFTVLT